MKNTLKLLSLLMVICMLFGSCAQVGPEVANAIADGIGKSNTTDNEIVNTGVTNDSDTDRLSVSNGNDAVPEKGTYNEGVVLVKYDGEMNEDVLSQLDLASATSLYSGSSWYTVQLKADADTVETVTYLRELGCFDQVDYDYVMGVSADLSNVDVSGNPDYAKENNHKVHKIPEGWDEIKKNGKHPGGSPDVIVAVIDTGVDYNHLDLRNNIWVNSGEIPNNGIDDDGNGYIDDVYGWNFVGNHNDPMDDNGHGTHVAGIIAAENNDIGGVGVAYNCKIMVLKAGNSSGYFNNSDIARAIEYAYMNGASVINMSFGGSFISIAVEEALENAYNTCVLVAAAGNNGACNNFGCPICLLQTVSYPAALPYVIGVMSTNSNGSAVSFFSNYDHYPYNSVEYEVYAVGEAIPSTWPGNKYATLSGTSMAAPTVSGIAALLRSAYPDRETYSTKYLQSQIVNTGTIHPYNSTIKSTDYDHSVANVYEALTRIPTPSVNFYDYSIDDSTSISAKNNGNGVIDAGETVRLFIALQNRGGVATNVQVTIDTVRNNDPSLTDLYFTLVNNTMTLSDIGTYSVRESGEDKYFEIIVSDDCPNDYLVDFNIHFMYENGMDEEDASEYYGWGIAQFNVSNGYHLPSVISEDTTFTADRLYIVGTNVIILAGVTVTFEEGCRIQFYDDSEFYNSPRFLVYGNLNMKGSKDNMILVYPSERHPNFGCLIDTYGTVTIDYVDSVNLIVNDKEDNSSTGASVISNSSIKFDTFVNKYVYAYSRGGMSACPHIKVNSFINCYIENHVYLNISAKVYDGNFILTCGSSVGCSDRGDPELPGIFPNLSGGISFTNNIIYSDSGKETRYTSSFYFSVVNNNLFSSSDDKDFYTLVPLSFGYATTVSNNTFSQGYQKYADQEVILGYLDANGNPTVDIYGSCSDLSALYPHVVSVELFNKDGEPITTIGNEEIKVRVTFNRPMDTAQNTFLTFGTIEPYADYRIDGEWVSDTVWEGNYTLKAQIENGQNFLKVNNACAAEDPTKTVFGEYFLYEFIIDTTAALSMNLQATATENGINLTWAQDDYDTLLGYNIYRADSKDGNYVKLNPSVLLATDESFLDDNAEPGKTYWYTYTVVLSDFTESAPAGKVMCTAQDTLAPNLYHTPVNQGYADNNLVISCTASDNVAISSVTLYYRTAGTTEWKSLTMSKQSDKYSATIFGSELTLDGLEYYIVASDGRNTISKGSAEAPYTVVIKDASAISRLGDVDGDGVVTTKDALMLMQCLNGDLLLSDDEFRRADLNGDGSLSSSEALRILQYINGKLTTLEM